MKKIKTKVFGQTGETISEYRKLLLTGVLVIARTWLNENAQSESSQVSVMFRQLLNVPRDVDQQTSGTKNANRFVRAAQGIGKTQRTFIMSISQEIADQLGLPYGDSSATPIEFDNLDEAYNGSEFLSAMNGFKKTKEFFIRVIETDNINAMATIEGEYFTERLEDEEYISKIVKRMGRGAKEEVLGMILATEAGPIFSTTDIVTKKELKKLGHQTVQWTQLLPEDWMIGDDLNFEMSREEYLGDEELVSIAEVEEPKVEVKKKAKAKKK